MPPGDRNAAADDAGASARVLVVGYGNTLRRDDGVGVVAAVRMAEDARFADVEVRAAYQLLPEMTLDVAACSLVVFVDADLRALPGSVEVRRLDGRGPRSDTDARPEPGASSHHVGGGELVALAAELTGHQPEALEVGIGVADVELGEGLSASVEAAVPRVLDAILGVIDEHLGG